jgi:hypothetical protein
MKKETIERWVLLDSTGELDAVRRWLLRRQPEADRIRRDVQDLVRSAGPAETAGPSDAVLLAIEREARRMHAGRPGPDRASAWRPVLALASVAAIALAAWLAVRPAPEVTAPQAAPADPELAWDNGIDTDLAELKSLVAMATDETESSADATAATDINSLASELMELEGPTI